MRALDLTCSRWVQMPNGSGSVLSNAGSSARPLNGVSTLFLDTDVVVLRQGFLQHCVQQLAAPETELEILMQNYARHDVEAAAKMALDRGDLSKERVLKQAQQDGGVDTRYGMCSGILALRSTPSTRAAFAIDVTKVQPGWNDEMYLNELTTRHGSLKYRALPIMLFPSHKFWMSDYETHTNQQRVLNARPFLVHYNSIARPEDKRAFMRSDKLWYITERDEANKSHRKDDDGDEDEDAIV